MRIRTISKVSKNLNGASYSEIPSFSRLNYSAVLISKFQLNAHGNRGSLLIGAPGISEIFNS